MANIQVQTKKHNMGTAWIWLAVVLLIAAAVAYYLVTKNRNDGIRQNNSTTARLKMRDVKDLLPASVFYLETIC